ncbi:MAG: MATE family efflux transporter [Clostridiales bacterium]|nr:MATE family efflux transporter [Clostridiales bacterium]MDY5514479.1 MATE family efflux transporter [Candidatus Ventricola sp.]
MRKMTEGSIARHLLAYAVPLILGNFFQLTYNAVDSILIGKFAGEGALAAVSAANPVMTIVILGVSGISIGASVLMSRFYGAGDEEALRREVATTILFGAAASLIVFAAGLALSPYILALMSVPPEILSQANTYLRIIFVGFLFTFQYNILAAALRSVGDSRTPVIFLAAASVLNGLLDVLFVALLRWGVAGAGLATVIAEGVSALLCAVYMRRHVPLLRLGLRELRVDRALLRQTVASGSITALQQACQPVGKLLIQRAINAQGISMIAAFNAVSRVDDFACIPEQSISSGMMTCVAQNRGAGQRERVRETLRTGMTLEILYGVLICAVTLLGRTPVMRLFAAQDSERMVQMGVDYLTWMAFFYLLPGLTNGIQGYFRGMGEMKTTLVATAIQISVRTIVVYLLVPTMGLTAAAWACAIGWCCMLVYAFVRYRSVSRAMEA